MAEKTITELKKLFLVLSNQYQEYKEVVGELKHVLNDRGKTIINNKLEIFTLKKDGYSGPPEDEQFFKICQAMQRKLLKRHTETYYNDFKFFERSIEKKFRMMDTELQHLQRVSILWDEKQDPVENMSKIIKRKEMEINALKQEMFQLFKQKEQDRIQITTLEQESKPANEKILLLKRSNEKERSIRRQTLEQLRQTKGECKDLDTKLKIIQEENYSLHEKYLKENILHKNTKDNIRKLQGQVQQMVQEKNCLQGKYEKEKNKYKQTKESLDKTIEDLHVQLKETVKEHKCVEKNYEKEKSAHKSTKETLEQAVEELQGWLEEARQEHECLEKSQEEERSAHESTKEALNHIIEELQGRLKQAAEEHEDLEQRFQKEISTSKSTREELLQTMKELKRACSENHLLATKEEELQEQLQNRLIENKALEEIYQQKKMEHKHRREELEQSIEKLQLQLQQVEEKHKVMNERIEELEAVLQQGEEKKSSSEEEHLKEVEAHKRNTEQLEQNIQELQGRLQQEREEKQLLLDNYEKEKSSLIRTQEKLRQATQQNKEKSANIEELQLQLEQAAEESKSSKENLRKEMSAHKHSRKQLSRLEETYEKEKSEHKTTKEELQQWTEKAKELQVQVQQAEEANNPLAELYPKEKSDLKRVTDKAEKPSVEKSRCQEINCKHERAAHKSSRKELEQLRNQYRVMHEKLVRVEQELQAGEEKELLQENQATDTSGLQLQLQQVLEDLDQARSQNTILESKLQEVQHLRGNGRSNQELEVQTRDRQLIQDLQACLSAVCDTKTLKQRLAAMRRRYLEAEQEPMGEREQQEEEQEQEEKQEEAQLDLSKRLRGCENLLKVKSDVISRLEEKIWALVQVCAQRERKYVQILNHHVVKEHQLSRELEKASKPIPQKVSSWWHEKVLKNALEAPPEEEEQMNLYPEDWRLPDFPEFDHLLS